ncbi:hypothetical protein PoB_005732000 [Plakobranchus ocellatus]|uniref:Uncharacterized protein n=1 Tax=Plakobranchus ocellatus TaxID=259542 RepID=A0AAV4CGG6_9GAST|nr:hypothetical protein PoB_005732000 [Plakobranchus ocellatus]
MASFGQNKPILFSQLFLLSLPRGAIDSERSKTFMGHHGLICSLEFVAMRVRKVNKGCIPDYCNVVAVAVSPEANHPCLCLLLCYSDKHTSGILFLRFAPEMGLDSGKEIGGIDIKLLSQRYFS